MIDLRPFAELVPRDHGLSVIVTRRADQSPHTSVVNAGVLHHPVTGDDGVAFVPPAARSSSPTCAPTPPSPSSCEPAGSGSPSRARLS